MMLRKIAKILIIGAFISGVLSTPTYTRTVREPWDTDKGGHSLYNVSGIGIGSTAAPVVRTATVVVAASDASAKSKAQADYVCDGTDDQVEIQAAIDTEKHVKLTEGTFVLSNRLQLDSDTLLEGSGFGTVLKMANNANAVSVINAVGVNNVIVRSLKVDGNRANNTKGYGIRFDQSNNIVVEDCFVTSCYDTNILIGISSRAIVERCFTTDSRLNGISVEESDEVIVKGNVAYNNSLHGIRVRAADPSTHYGNVVIGNKASNNGNFGIYVRVDNTAIIGNTANNNGVDYDGIVVIEPASFCTVMGNIANSNGDDGIDVAKGRGNVVIGNECNDNGDEGISLHGPYQIAIGNTCKNNTNNGIDVTLKDDGDTVEGCLVQSNFLAENGGYGVLVGTEGLTGTVQNNSILGNTFYNNTSGAISDAGSGTIIKDNQGYTTENSGTASIPKDGSTTYKDWPHGLDATPTNIKVTPQEAAGVDVFVPQANIDSTNFRIQIPSAQTKSTADVTGAVADDGGVQADETTEATNATTNDMTLLPATPAVDDAYYFGGDEMFWGIELKYSTAGDGTWTITWEYWNGSSWTALSGVTDDTNGFTATAGTYDITFTIPTDWEKTDVGGITDKYWVRARVSSFTSITTQPLGDQAWILEALHFMWEAKAE